MTYLDKSKLIILVTGTTIEPWDQNWKECENTWIPELRNLGYNVMVAIGNPDLDTDYCVSNNIIYFKADDTKRGLFDKFQGRHFGEREVPGGGQHVAQQLP